MTAFKSYYLFIIIGITPESKVYTETLSNIDLCIKNLLENAGTKL